MIVEKEIEKMIIKGKRTKMKLKLKIKKKKMMKFPKKKNLKVRIIQN